MVYTLPKPLNLVVGIFLVLLAAVCAAAPISLVYRSLGIVLATYLAFSSSGMPFAYMAALLAPPIGLIARDPDWFIMLPITLSSLLLAVLALEFAWRYPALILSPVLYIIPQVVALRLSKNELFSVDLPWEPAGNWVSLHFLVAFAGALVAVYLDRRRERVSNLNDELEEKIKATTLPR
jgi:hypothetical protein